MIDNDYNQDRWHACANKEELQLVVLEKIVSNAEKAISNRSQFHIVLAGGGTPRDIYKRLRTIKTDWTKWHIYFGDERCLPIDDPERNSAMAKEAWLDHVAIPSQQIHMIPAELGPSKASEIYNDVLRKIEDFDVVLLGLGEDGHTASLFPSHDWGTEPDAKDVLAIYDSPKPPPERVSLSACRLSRASHVIFIVTGKSKLEAMSQWRAGKDIPARAIQPTKGVDVYMNLD